MSLDEPPPKAAILNVLPDGKTFPILSDQTLLAAALAQRVPHVSVCGGKGRCSTCRVRILSGHAHCSPPTEIERAVLAQLRLGQEVRLACQTRATGPVTLRRLVLDEADTALANELREGGNLLPAGEERHLAILFADIRGFTPFAAKLPPYDVVHVLNRYFYRMEGVVRRHGGRLNNLVGDGLLALFGLEPLDNPTLCAVCAGLDMLHEVRRLSRQLEALYQSGFDIRVGVHHGQVVVGAVGTPRLHKVTVIGDAVNLASRIEAANKETGTRFLISQAAFDQVQDQVKLGKALELELPGKQGRHALYEVVGLAR